MGHEAIFVSGLRKSYRGREVLKGVSFSAPAGSIYALLGSNGAGKTTVIRILTGQLRADGGDARVEGRDSGKDRRELCRVFSLTGQFSAVDGALTGRENLKLMGRLLQLPDPAGRAAELLEAFGLSDAGKRRAAEYSGGMRRRLDIAMSLVGNPKVIFLDEPTTGLDPQSRRAMWETIRGLNRSGTTIFLTTQYLEEAEELADRAAILDRGRILAEGTPASFKARIPQGAITLSFDGEEDFRRAEALLGDCSLSKDQEGRLTVFTGGTAEELAGIFHRLYESRVRISGFSQCTPSLEEAFLKMIGENGGNGHEEIL